MVLDALFFRLRIAGPWRDLLDVFGPWRTIYGWYQRLARQGIWERLLRRLAAGAKSRIRLVDGTHVVLHPCAANPAGGAQKQAMGRTRGGRNPKIMALTDGRDEMLEHIRSGTTSLREQRRQLDLMRQMHEDFAQKHPGDALLEGRVSAFENAFRMQVEATRSLRRHRDGPSSSRAKTSSGTGSSPTPMSPMACAVTPPSHSPICKIIPAHPPEP